MDKKLIIPIILSVLITAIVVGGGVYLLNKVSFEKEKQQMQQQINDLNNQISRLNKSEGLDELDDTSDWQTYRNEEYRDNIKVERICGENIGDYELRVYDSEGRITGSINGEEKRDIPNSFYFTKKIVPVGVPGSINGVTPAEVIIFEPKGEYVYEVYGIKEGFYNLELKGLFNAIKISIYPNETHRYSINTAFLDEENKKTPVSLDLDNDGKFEIEFTSDYTLTCEEFNSEIKKKFNN